MSSTDRRKLVDRTHRATSIRRQCELLGIARSGLYRSRRAANDNDLPLRRQIDELFTSRPFRGSRPLTAPLRTEGHSANRKRVQRLMRKMGIAALGPRRRPTKFAPGHKIFLYLLRGVTVERPIPVWCGNHLHSARPWLPLSGSDHRLGQPGGAGVAAAQYHGRLVLGLGAGGGAGALRPAGTLQHRPGQPVHRHCLHRRADGGRSAHLDGRRRRVSDHLPPPKSSGALGLAGPIGAQGALLCRSTAWKQCKKGAD
jgi:putative transposase